MADNFNNINETAEDGSVGDLLRTLKHVDAPNDFDFKLRARIAERDPGSPSRGWWPLPVYVYALVMIVVVGGMFFFLYQPGSEPVPSVASKGGEIPAAGSPFALTPAAPNSDQEVVTSPNQKNPVSSPGDPRTSQEKGRTNAETESPGGSKVSGLGVPKQILPPGLNIPSVLNFLGLDTKFEGDALKVTSVRSGSVGDKTGLKAGDIVEAIDNTPINPATKLGNSVELKSLTVRRGGEQLRLNIRVQ